MATREYIGARYVPKFYQNSVDGSTQWQPNVVYEPLTWVTLQNSHMYISKKQVPATVGTPAENIDYWLDIGSYNGIIQNLQDEVDAINRDLTDVEGDVGTLQTDVSAIQTALTKTALATNSRYVTVGAVGCNFTTINAAITAVSQYCSTSNRVGIIIMPGTYGENITLFPNPGIDLIGIGMPIVSAGVAYPNSPLYIAGDSYVEGIKFVSTMDSSYAVHIEAAGSGTLRFVNCIFEATQATAVGYGADPNGTDLQFTDCTFVSWDDVCLYAHNYPNGATVGSALTCKDCTFHSLNNSYGVIVEDATVRAGVTTPSFLTVSLGNCVFYTTSRFRYMEYDNVSIAAWNYIPDGKTNVTLRSDSINTAYGANYDKCRANLKGYIHVNPAFNYGIPYDDAMAYDWTVVRAQSYDLQTDLTAAFNVMKGNGSVYGTCSNTSYGDKMVWLELKGVPSGLK